MSIEEKIKKLFRQVVENHAGNKSNAAESLGINHVTFWGWHEGTRGLNKTLCSAIDRAGGVLVIPGDEKYQKVSPPVDIEKLAAENAALKSEVARLQAQKEVLLEALGRPPAEKAPDTEASRKEARYLPLNGTEGK